VNDAPTGNGDSYSTNEETTLNVAAPGVLGNDSDVEGSTLTAALASGPSHGSLTLNANGSFDYTPDTNYAGPDSFTYRANDGSANSTATTVNLTVNNVNDAPDCAADSDNVDEDTTLTGSVRCTDADGDTLTYSVPAGQGPAHAASFSLGSDGSFSYTPAADYNGPDSFQFQASDGTASSNAATFTITVNPVDDVPTGGGTTGGTTGVATGGTAGVTATKTKCKKPKKSSASAAKKKRCKKKK
jgi:VCBS repeat-containing protein